MAATVGYGDFSFATQSPDVRAFGIGLIVLGVALESTTFALLTNVLVSRNIEASLGRQQATGLADHVIVIGLGSVGVRVLEGLIAQGREVVVLERDENNRYLNQARALGVPVVIVNQGTTRGDELATATLDAPLGPTLTRLVADLR